MLPDFYLEIAHERAHDLHNQAAHDRLVRQASQSQPRISNTARKSLRHSFPVDVVFGRIAKAIRPILGAA